MENQTCSECNHKKAPLKCGCCSAILCKNCSHFLDETTFFLMPQIPLNLSHAVYCGHCFTDNILPAQVAHEALVEKAKAVSVFNKNQGKETRLIRRNEKMIQVIDCKDHDELLLRLAYVAAQMNYNALVDVEMNSKKVRDGSYQTTIWSGTGRPAQLHSHQVVKDRSIWQNPN